MFYFFRKTVLDQNFPVYTILEPIIYHFIGKLFSKLIFDFGKFPNQKMHESESAGYLKSVLKTVS